MEEFMLSFHQQNPLNVWMQSWVSSFVKNCCFKHHWQVRYLLADVGCKSIVLRFATNLVCCPWSSNFSKIQWSNWTNFKSMWSEMGPVLTGLLLAILLSSGRAWKCMYVCIPWRTENTDKNENEITEFQPRLEAEWNRKVNIYIWIAGFLDC
jgi:hypothetical protein